MTVHVVIPVEDINEWGDLSFRDLPSIENTLHNLEKGRYNVLTSQTRDILNKAIDLLNCAHHESLISEEDRRKGEYLIKISLSTKQITSENSEFIIEILYNYNDFLDKRLNGLDGAIDELFDSGWERLEEIKEQAGFIIGSIESFQEKLFAKRENLVKEYIFKSKTGKYITEIANELGERFGAGFTISNVKKIIDRLEQNESITTWGGWGTGKRNRICYPNFRVIDRSLIDGTEQKLKGVVGDTITGMFEPRSASSFGWEIYEFNSGYEEPVYVVAGELFRAGLEIDSIGLFSHANLKNQMKVHLGYILKHGYEQYSDKDSLIAYIVNDPEGKTLWYNERESRTLELLGRGQSESTRRAA